MKSLKFDPNKHMRSVGHESGFVPETEQKLRYEILANSETREALKERVLRFVKNVHDRNIDSLVYLDRSARPFAWMTREVWHGLYPDEKMPEVRFANIGTSTFVNKGIARIAKPNATESNRLREKIKKQESEDVWMAADDLPREVQNSISFQTNVGDQLQSIFKDVFVDRKLLVVDEMGSSGSTQSAALGLFTMAFPHAKSIESVALFAAPSAPTNVREEQIHADRKLVPWLQISGMSGVLELPDTVLQSANITKNNVEKLSNYFQEIIQVHLDDAVRDAQNVLEEIAFVRKELSERMVAKNPGREESVDVVKTNKLLDICEDILTEFIEKKTERSFDHVAYTDAQQQLDKFFFFRLDYLKESRLENFRFKLFYPQNDLAAIKPIRSRKIEQSNIEELKRKTRQLRKEIKQLGQELIDEQLRPPYEKVPQKNPDDVTRRGVVV